MNAKKLFVVLGLGASIVALAYPDAPTNHAAAPAATAINAPPPLIDEAPPPEFVVQQTSELDTLRRTVREQADTIKQLQEQIARLTVAPPPTPEELYPLPTDPPRKPAAQPRQATGHWERGGLFGRQSYWVSDQPAQQQPNYGGSCSGGSCGAGFFGRRR